MSQIDTTIPRIEVDGFACPLGVYPTDSSAFSPLQGYYSEFEQADAGEDPDEGWEEWPDRYLYDIVVTHKRLPALLRSLFALLPGRVFPILDVLGHDAYREVDPYIAYEPVGMERFSDLYRRHRGWFLEDGLVGFGAMSIEPFVYIYVDEHKIVTVRAETPLKDRVERVLSAYDLPALEEPRGVDSVEHEHRETLIEPPQDDEPARSRPLGPDEEPPPAPGLHRDEIIDELREGWGLTLNIDPERNVDDEGNDLGDTPWRCVVRVWQNDEEARHFEVLLVAGSLDQAEQLALDAVSEEIDKPLDPDRAKSKRDKGGKRRPESREAPKPPETDDGIEADPSPDAADAIESEVIMADRLLPEELAEILGKPKNTRVPEPGALSCKPID